MKVFFAIIIFLLSGISFTFAAQTYYVSPIGSDINSGTSLTTPFKTINKAASLVTAGDIVYLRGGVYAEYVKISSSHNGTAGNYITFQAYQNEKPVIDGSGKASNIAYPWGESDHLFHVSGKYIKLKGIEFKNAASFGVYIAADYAILDSLHIHNCYLTGIYFYMCSYGTATNCIVHECYDYGMGGTGGGGNADGIGASSGNVVTTIYGYNTIKNNTVYSCSDDGIDLWTSQFNVLEGNVVYQNGYTSLSNGGSITSGLPAGDGNGYKLGGLGSGNHTVKNCLAYFNRMREFDDNSGTGNILLNNTAYDTNGYCFAFYTAGNTLKNNISYGSTNLLSGSLTQVTNSWNVGVTNPIFVSFDPFSPNFLHLSGCSPAIDVGTNVGLPFTGPAPDLGAFEYTAPSDVFLSIFLPESTTIGEPAIAGRSYSWSSVPSGFYSTSANPTVTPTVTTTYTVIETITATSCTYVKNYVVSVVSMPTIQATAISFSNVSHTTMTVSWTNGNGSKRMLVVKENETPGVPLNKKTYLANSTFGTADSIGPDEYVLYNESGNSINIDGLKIGTNYTFKVFEYNGNSGSEYYLTTNNAASQTTLGVSYYSNGSGDPTVLSNWKTNRNGSGISPADFAVGERFIIENGDNMVAVSPWAISGNYSKLQIESGGSLTASASITLATETTFQINNGGTFIQNTPLTMASTILAGTEVFAPSSNFEIRVMPSGTAAPTSPGWGNLIINQANGSTNLVWAGNLSAVQGNLIILATGSGATWHALTSTSATTNIGGNLTVSGGNLVLSTHTSSTTVNIAGNLVVNGGILDIAASSGSVAVYVSGNVSVNSGTLTESGSTSSSRIVFNKNGAQSFTGGGAINNRVNFEVGTASATDLGLSVISGGGNFTLLSGATLKTAHPLGLNGSITATGTKTFSPGANYVYNGSGNQISGSLLPATINSLLITGTSTLSLSNSPQTVTTNVTIDPDCNVIVGAAQSLIVEGNLILNQ